MLHHGQSQADLLKADIDRLRDEKNATATRREAAVQAMHRAEEQVFQAAADINNADVTAGVLTLQIDAQLEELAALLPRRPED